MTSLIKVPFASSGDKTAVPDTDATGAVNMTQGYGQAYSLDPATDPSAKRIERDKMNWLFNRITQAINEIQVSGVAPFITSTDNGGSPFSYDKGAIVSLSGAVYQSLTAANTTTPPGANWSLLPEKIQPLDATLTALAGLTGAADRLAYFNGVDTAALTALTGVGRDIIGKASIADVLTYLGLGGASSGLFPIGMPFYWPNAKMPNELLPEWSGMTFLKWNGSTFSATTYPKLALIIPSLTLVESRGEFIRNWDDGRGVDSGRVLLSAQDSAVPNVKGAIGSNGVFWDGASTVFTGAFQQTIRRQSNVDAAGNSTGTGFDMDLRRESTVYQDGVTEARPRSVAFNFLVRAA